MVYSRYGQVFKEIRNDKGLPMSYFENIGIARSVLSRFENGHVRIRFETLDIMLQEMNVNLAEYELMFNNFSMDFQAEFILEAEEADYAKNIKKLQELDVTARDSGYFWFAIMAKARFSHLSLSEVEALLDILGSIKQYGYLQICLVYFTIDNLETNNIIEILSRFEQKRKNYYDIFKYLRRILQVAYRASIILDFRGEKRLSDFILKIYNRKKVTHDLFITQLSHS